MAWSIRGTANWGTNTATVPTHSAGDMILVASFRDGSTTPPSLPSGQNLTNIYANTGANTCSVRVAYKIAASSSETIGTFTNGTTTCCIVLQNAAPGAFVQNRGNSTTFNYAALTFLENDNSSGAIGFCFSRYPAAAAATAPSGMTNHNSNSDATDIGAVHYDMTGTGWSSTNVATGVAATGWQTFVLEILDQELPTSNYVGHNAKGATQYGVLTDTTQVGYRVQIPVAATIDEVWVYMNHFDAQALGKTCIYSDTTGPVPNSILDNGDEFNHNQFPAWRKSKGYTYNAAANEYIWPSLASNDSWYTYGDASGPDYTYDKSGTSYTFENPSTGTGRSVANIKLSFIVKYTPTAPPSNQNNFFFAT